MRIVLSRLLQRNHSMTRIHYLRNGMGLIQFFQSSPIPPPPLESSNQCHWVWVKRFIRSTIFGPTWNSPTLPIHFKTSNCGWNVLVTLTFPNMFLYTLVWDEDEGSAYGLFCVHNNHCPRHRHLHRPHHCYGRRVQVVSTAATNRNSFHQTKFMQRPANIYMALVHQEQVGIAIGHMNFSCWVLFQL